MTWRHLSLVDVNDGSQWINHNDEWTNIFKEVIKCVNATSMQAFSIETWVVTHLLLTDSWGPPRICAKFCLFLACLIFALLLTANSYSATNSCHFFFTKSYSESSSSWFVKSLLCDYFDSCLPYFWQTPAIISVYWVLLPFFIHSDDGLFVIFVADWTTLRIRPS